MVEKSLAEWQSIIAKTECVLSRCQNYLPADSVEAVCKYLYYDEYEMAVEGLLIEIMKLKNMPTELSPEECIGLAESVGLDQDVVFQHDFWMQLVEYCNATRSNRD